ncbi:hypothetical protein CkaCkLH20_00311 [Colletotrichum karsti]|uniref:FAD dependent oxidoreductase domain-containing protein n=1 Tax=Colletotrichum karsti TaxID=1095194 RepID=A0A9P6IGA3_9PEZI|nr:uncharacterized protein CkaCkLH20_00311 [Colletotrichum karsti]KAF9882275.1 hypothetical protein CkaCkLH20_00311 [Colletotrichum karsti]
MATWDDRVRYFELMDKGDDGSNTGIATTAPCPADYEVGKSYWIEEYPIDFDCRSAPLPEEDVDVVVIGSGITAAAVLHNLAEKRHDLKVAVVEARGICSGATGRNGGHLCRAEGTELRNLVEELGFEEAVRLSNFGVRNRDLTLSAIDKLGIQDKVDLELTGTRVVFASEEEKKTYLEELDFAETHGLKFEGHYLKPEKLVEESNIALEMGQFGAASLDKSGTIFPRKLVAELLRDAIRRMPGLTIHPYNPVRSVDKISVQTSHGSAPSYTTTTDNGIIRSRAVVHATNAYASYLIPSLRNSNGVVGCKAECIAVKPNVAPSGSSNPHGLRGGLGFDEFGHYIIQRPNNGPFIYGWSTCEKIGEYDDNTPLSCDENQKPAGQDVMTDLLEKGFPHSFGAVDLQRDVSHRWSGIQGFTKSGASLVGRPSEESPGEFMSVGHNGEGMGRCFACATVMTDMLVHYLDGKKHDTWSRPDWFPESFLYGF